jgi:hypothetical protein
MFFSNHILLPDVSYIEYVYLLFSYLFHKRICKQGARTMFDFFAAMSPAPESVLATK